jgi:hypothetical protein
VYTVTKKLDKAKETLERLAREERSERVNDLADELDGKANTRLECVACGRAWKVPKDIPAQGSLHLTAQPPDDLPAGTCPDCQEHYCIGCAKEHLGEDGRFRCAKCGKPLKLIDQNCIWLLNRWQDAERAKARRE